LEIGTVRIIAGISRGRRVTVPGVPGVRPTLSRIREPLFTMLGEDLVEGDVLDLFAGSGALGIEALSRGARHAVFVDENPLCLRAIRENLERCGFQSQTEVLRGRLPSAFRIVGRALPRKADIVLLDPPYGGVKKASMLESMHRFSLLKENARIVFEHFHKDVFTTIPAGFFVEKQRRYGDTSLTFFRYLTGDIARHEK
jgi:16S rRNA (guanine966-N2)-methyltransferase